MESTRDPNIVILERHTDKNPKKDYVIYQNTRTGQKWRIDGRCNKCGLCEVGSNGNIKWNPDVLIGDPNACEDLDYPRLDSPVLPEIKEMMKRQKKEMLKQKLNVSKKGECTLSGEYL